MNGMDGIPEWEQEMIRDEFAREERARRRRQDRLGRHPDCSDPEHPGCPECRPQEEE